MAKRLLRINGDEILRKKSKEVRKITPSIIALLDDMAETMYDAPGVGIAAVQVGILKRVIVIDVDGEKIELINPVIMSQEGAQIGKEGCLSIPGESGYVERPEKIIIQAMNREGEIFTREADSYLAVAIGHEMDHLDGVLFMDKVIEDYEEEEEQTQEQANDHE